MLAPGALGDQMGAARGMTGAEALAATADNIPLGRFAQPGEMADVILFLCSERSSTVAGAAWSADGGAVAIIF
ncbi:unannotated protein [freshwater metagenome]|uniref:Unannotated protein n=1 Tax=freshwater metagenome TaxID=449393 RepID=A0A6J7II25_9ZZZZ